MAALNRLVAGVAHEFHGPVGAIQSTNDTLLRWADRLAPLLEGTDHDELREYLRRTITAVHQGMEVTRQATARITSIVKRMTLYAHPDHERCGFVQLVDHPLTLIILTRTILAALPATD